MGPQFHSCQIEKASRATIRLEPNWYWHAIALADLAFDRYTGVKAVTSLKNEVELACFFN